MKLFFYVMIYALGIGCLASMSGCSAQQPRAPLAMIRDSSSERSALVQHLHPGDRLTLLESDAPGVVRRIWFTAKSDEARLYDKLVLRAWWDGEAEPSIEVPFGDFFGTGFGEERRVSSAAVEMIPAGLPGHAALTCWLPMPFESARIEVENQSEEGAALFYILDWEKVDKLDDDMGRLHAAYRQSRPVERGRHHTALVAQGEGQYVGMVFSIQRNGPGAWVEGGEDFYIDVREDEWEALNAWDRELVFEDRHVSEDTRSIANQPMSPVSPSMPGIGAEDYFCQSWGFRESDNSLYHGVSLGPDNEEDRMTAYRFHIVDPVRFKKNLWVQFRNHGWDVQQRADDITTVVFWYQREPHRVFEPLPSVAERVYTD